MIELNVKFVSLVGIKTKKDSVCYLINVLVNSNNKDCIAKYFISKEQYDYLLQNNVKLGDDLILSMDYSPYSNKCVLKDIFVA